MSTREYIEQLKAENERLKVRVEELEKANEWQLIKEFKDPPSIDEVLIYGGQYYCTGRGEWRPYDDKVLAYFEDGLFMSYYAKDVFKPKYFKIVQPPKEDI